MATCSRQQLRQWLQTQPQIDPHFQEFVNQLRRRKIRGSDRCARETLHLLKRMLGSGRWLHTQQMMAYIRAVGAALMEARPMELSIGNIVRRVLYIIREEFASKLAEDAGMQEGVSYSMQPSLEGVLANKSAAPDYTIPVKNLMSNIMGQVSELEEELDSVQDEIQDQAEDHIPDGAKILTFGKSRSVEAFFRAAAKKQRNFQVIVCESAPYYGGQEMAKCLCAAGIDTTLIQDAAVFAVMPLVDKVFLPTHAVMANGGLIAPSGGHMLALAAREHAVPVVCVTGLFKLCPVYAHDLDEFNELTSPAAVLDYAGDQTLMENAEVLNPEYDYVPPDLLGLYITNTGGHQPSYIYRLLAECYHAEDRSLE